MAGIGVAETQVTIRAIGMANLSVEELRVILLPSSDADAITRKAAKRVLRVIHGEPAQ